MLKLNKAVFIGFGAIAALFAALSGNSNNQDGETPSPKPQPKAKTSPVTAADVSYTTWHNYATGQDEPNAPPFLTWGAGQDGSNTSTAQSSSQPTLPKAGERWRFVFVLNRPLGFFEISAAKSAFAAQIPDQNLNSATQNEKSIPPTVTLTTTYTKDATSKSFPVGYTIAKSGIVATVSSAQRIG